MITHKLTQVHQYLKTYRKKCVIIIFACAIFFAYICFSIISPKIFLSPDETANYFFAKQFIESGRMWSVDALNLDAYDRSHPRSMESFGGIMYPSVSFGLSLIYGTFGSLLGENIMNILTAVFAILAIFVFYKIIEKIFESHIALSSAIILSFHPAWWFYSARGWQNNVLYCSLLIFASAIFIFKPFSKNIFHDIKFARMLDYFFGLSFFALAVFVRPADSVWIFGALIAIYIYFSAIGKGELKKEITYIAIAIAGALLAFIFIKLFSFRAIASATSKTAIESNDSNIISQFFPYGFHAKQVIRSFFWYYIAKMWFFTVFCFAGFWLVLKEYAPKLKELDIKKIFLKFRKNDEFGERKSIEIPKSPFDFGPRARTRGDNLRGKNIMIIGYVIVFATITIIMILWYGSWDIHDNPNPLDISLANSYIRYWLPSFIMSIPFAAIAIEFFAKSKKIKYAIFAVMFALSSYLVFSGSDGFIRAHEQLIINQDIKKRVLEIVPTNGIIITDRHDKIFFPERRVMFPIEHAGTFESINSLKDSFSMFVYRLKFSSFEFEEYNNALKQMNLKLEEVQSFLNEQLYKISKMQNENN